MTKEPAMTRVRVSIDAVMARELAAEAERLERPTAWLVRMAWTMARGEIREFEKAKKEAP